jgi:hypothetical protein
MKTVQTRNGPRCVESVDPTEALWAVYKGGKPTYLSVSKDHKGRWSFSVWGANEEEVGLNLEDLLHRASTATPAPRKQSRSNRRIGCACGSRDGFAKDTDCPLCRANY